MTDLPTAARDEADGSARARRARLSLYPLVFVCGAVLMCLEIAGSRFLEFTFGSTIFTWGSIIGVFMAALAAGYYSGGLLADRRPRFLLLTGLVALAGLTILPIPWIRTPLCDYITRPDHELGPRLGPLVASLLLYLVPSALLGMVSPFAVRLCARDMRRIGNVAGRLYALSTVGSILGTLLTAFWLIPSLGTRMIIFSLGLTLLAVAGAAGLWWFRCADRSERDAPGRTALLVTLFVAPLLAVVPAGLYAAPRGPGVSLDEPLTWLIRKAEQQLAEARKPRPGESEADAAQRLAKAEAELTQARMNSARVEQHLVEPAPDRPAWRESPYHLILVTEQDYPVSLTTGEYTWRLFDLTQPSGLTKDGRWRRRRLLRFNERVESAIYIDEQAGLKPAGVESAVGYTALLHLGLLFHGPTLDAGKPAVKKVLVVGCGGGILPMEFRHHYGAEVDVVDIDPEVFRFAEAWMRFHPDERLHTHVADGRQFIERAQEQWDFIILDAYSSGGRIPYHLVTQEFYQAVHARLAPGGVLASNVIAALERERSHRLYRAIYKTQLEAGFQQVYVFPKTDDPEGRILEEERDQERNIILVATDEVGRVDRFELEKRAQRLAALKEPGVWIQVRHFEQSARALIPRRADEMELETVPLLTDDYAPVEVMHGSYN